MHEKIASLRRQFHHKEARKLVDRYRLVSHEALNIQAVIRTHLAKPKHDAHFARFLNIMKQKAEEAAVWIVVVDPKNPTQACNRCGAAPEVKKSLSERTHHCNSCGYVADPDINAVQNV
jgi:putative transposase